MSKISYVPVTVEDLAMTAHIIGEHGAAAKALANMEQRATAGELPVCLQVSTGDRGGTYLVFDMRNPPEQLPKKWQKESLEAAAEIDAARKAEGVTL